MMEFEKNNFRTPFHADASLGLGLYPFIPSRSSLTTATTYESLLMVKIYIKVL